MNKLFIYKNFKQYITHDTTYAQTPQQLLKNDQTAVCDRPNMHKFHKYFYLFCELKKYFLHLCASRKCAQAIGRQRHDPKQAFLDSIATSLMERENNKTKSKNSFSVRSRILNETLKWNFLIR